MKRFANIYFYVFCLFFLNGIGERLYAQTEAEIRAAGRAVTDAGSALRPQRKFSGNDSIPWLFGGDVSMNLRSTQLSHWAGGGEDQLSINGITNMFYNFEKDKRTWENYLTLAYGFSQTGRDINDNRNKAIKSDDRIQFKSKVGQQMSPKVYYTASFLMRSQFSAGYRYRANDTTLISHFMAPVNMHISIGLDWRPNDAVSVNVSPLMGRTTYVRKLSDKIEHDRMLVLAQAGIPRYDRQKDRDLTDEEYAARTTRHEFGGGALISFRGNVFQDRVTYTSTIDLFSNYVDKPQNVSVYWTFNSKILIYRNISADFRLELKYDDKQKSIKEIDRINANGDTERVKVPGPPRVQTRIFYGIGLFYQF